MKQLSAHNLRPEQVALRLIIVLAILLIVHVLAMQANFNDALGIKERFGFHYWQIAFFDLDEEESFGTWFNSGLLFIAALLAIHRSRVLRAQEEPWHRWWLILGIGLCVLSMDEIAGMHELLNSMMGDIPWTVVGAPILALVGLSYLPFLWAHRWRTGLLFLLAGAIYGGGAVGVEHFTDSEVNSLHYNMWTALEEGMEMFGVIVFIYAVLDHVRGSPDQVVRIEVGIAARMRGWPPGKRYDRQTSQTIPAGRSLRCNDLPQRLPVVSGPADDQQVYLALVRLDSRCLGYRPALLPADAAGWLRLRPLRRQPIQLAPPGPRSCSLTRTCTNRLTHHPG